MYLVIAKLTLSQQVSQIPKYYVYNTQYTRYIIPIYPSIIIRITYPTLQSYHLFPNLTTNFFAPSTCHYVNGPQSCASTVPTDCIREGAVLFSVFCLKSSDFRTWMYGKGLFEPGWRIQAGHVRHKHPLRTQPEKPMSKPAV